MSDARQKQEFTCVFNHRFHIFTPLDESRSGSMPPAEAEAAYYRDNPEYAMAA